MGFKVPEDKQEEVDERTEEIMDEVYKAFKCSGKFGWTGIEALAKRVAMLEVLLMEIMEEYKL